MVKIYSNYTFLIDKRECFEMKNELSLSLRNVTPNKVNENLLNLKFLKKFNRKENFAL